MRHLNASIILEDLYLDPPLEIMYSMGRKYVRFTDAGWDIEDVMARCPREVIFVMERGSDGKLPRRRLENCVTPEHVLSSDLGIRRILTEKMYRGFFGVADIYIPIEHTDALMRLKAVDLE